MTGKLVSVLLLTTALTAAAEPPASPAPPRTPSIQAYLAPKGGFAPYNNRRCLWLPDGTAARATLENAVLDLIQRSGAGTSIRLVMYSFSARHIQDALLDAAERGADVRLLLDGVNRFSAGSREEILEKVRERSLPIQVKVVQPERMRELGRLYRHADGTEFAGTMHEKFGIFLAESRADAFIGSANLSYSSDSMFAENRLLVRDDPVFCGALLQEFARLWNDYAVCAAGDCQPEPVPTPARPGNPLLITNSELGSHRTSLTDQVTRLMQPAIRDGGTLDIAMFYLTRRPIAERLLRAAEAAPNLRIRLLLDQAQLEPEDDSEVLGPWLDQQIVEKNLRNFEIRYFWNPAAYGWDAERKPPGPAKVFALAPFLMHHKWFVVNRETLVNGSFNWTDLGEQNLENLVVVRDADPWSHETVQRFLAEFEHLWEHRGLDGAAARERRREIYQCIQTEGPPDAAETETEP